MRALRCLASTSMLFVLTAVLISAQPPVGAFGVPAAKPSSDPSKAALGQMEEKVYEHKYAADSDEARLSRLEKFVFGTAQTGTVAERVQRLQTSFASQADAIDKIPVAQNKQSSTTSSGAPISSSNAHSASDNTSTVTATPAFDGANYPRVTDLEKNMLNATYVHQPLAERLSRLETKAFGAPSKSNDMCERVDNLDEYAETHRIFKNHPNPMAQTSVASGARSGVFSNSILGGRSFPSYPGSEDGDSDDDKPKAAVNPFVNGVSGSDQRLSSMEEFVYGHNYATRPVQDRLERLEKRLVPYQHNLAQKDVTTRVNNLWNILDVANTLNTSPTAAHPTNTAAVASARPVPESTAHAANVPSQSAMMQATSAHHSWLHQLGKSLGSI